jgi:hypothetical protein
VSVVNLRQSQVEGGHSIRDIKAMESVGLVLKGGKVVKDDLPRRDHGPRSE